LRIFRARRPTINVRTKTGIKAGAKDKFLRPRRTAPMVAGINRAKEKLKASRGAKPTKRPAIMVVPEREIPGKRAIH